MLRKLIRRLLASTSISLSSTSNPRRPLTVESTDNLRETLENAVREMLINSCPCHYPRFRELASFNHMKYNAGPVFCADTNYLVSIATSKDFGYLEQTGKISEGSLGDYGDDLIYTCKKCYTVYRNVANQYSINFEFEYLTIENPRFNYDVGCPLSFPIPLYQGLFGFRESEITKCASDFKLSNQQELLRYLICTG